MTGLLKLEGQTVYLEEIKPKYFSFIIEWRNNKTLNHFLNQPFELTHELQTKWFVEYLKDPTQGLYIMVNKNTNEPFGTLGWTHYSKQEHTCIGGRILRAVPSYKGSRCFIEAVILYSDYLYNNLHIENMYAHIAKENIASIHFHEKYGYIENNQFKYLNERYINNMEQIEYFRSKTQYNIVKEKIIKKYLS